MSIDTTGENIFRYGKWTCDYSSYEEAFLAVRDGTEGFDLKVPAASPADRSVMQIAIDAWENGIESADFSDAPNPTETSPNMERGEFAKEADLIALRDQFAGLALAGSLANSKTDLTRGDRVRRAYDFADLMLIQRAGRPLPKLASALGDSDTGEGA